MDDIHELNTARLAAKVLVDVEEARDNEEQLLVYCTDTANAEGVARLYGDRLRYDHRRGRFLIWNRHHWQPDQDETIDRWVVETMREIHRQAFSMPASVRAKISAWAISSQNHYRVNCCTEMAKCLHPIADKGDNWDENIWLLGCRNGVVDLRTGQLRDGRPDDRITLSTGLNFDPEAQCPRWHQFLAEVFGNEELIDWIHRACGYSITGDTSEQDVFIGWGKGANGKDKFRLAIESALGDYAHTTPFSTFELYQKASIPNDIAALQWKRFVNGSETNDNTRLNEARIKSLVGGGRQSARYLHREFFTFEPHLKLWLFVNHKPKVSDDSFGFWRRVKLIPFTRTFRGDQDDKQLGDKLKLEAEGILAWLVLGCLKWQQRSIESVPSRVQEATDAYQHESDILGPFIMARCIEHPDTIVKAGDLYAAYKEYSIDEGMTERDKDFLSATAFGRKVKAKYSYHKERTGTFYEGIGVSV